MYLCMYIYLSRFLFVCLYIYEYELPIPLHMIITVKLIADRHTHTHIYIYIYIYIVIHRLTVSLYHNSSLWLDTLDAGSWDRNSPNFTLDLVSDRSANKRTTLAREL